MKFLIIVLFSFSLLGFSAGNEKPHVYSAEMSCTPCAENIKTGLKEMKKELKSYTFDLKAQTVSIVFEGGNKALTKDELKKLLSVSGYVLEPKKSKK